MLACLKRERESFSRVIKKHLGARRGGDLQRALKTIRLSEETLDAVEGQIECRHDSPVRAPEL